MNKKGFTLIELLAIVILLGIIATISMPIINDIIKTAKKNAGLSEATLIYNEINKYCDTEEIYESSDYKNICNKDIKQEDINKIVKLGNAKILNIKYEDGVKLLRIKSNDNIYILNNNKMIHLDELKETPRECFTIVVRDNNNIITKYDESCGTDIVIPNDINIIDDGAFFNKQLTNVKLNEGLEKIGINSFFGNQLYSIDFPYTLKEIGYGAFSFNQLKYVNFNEGLTTVGGNNFTNNQIEYVKIPSSLKIISKGMFKNNKIEKIDILNGVFEIQSESFSNNNIKNLYLPNSVTFIGQSAFSNNKIDILTLNENLKTIQFAAFSNNQISSLIIPESVELIGQRAFQSNKISNLKIKSQKVNIQGMTFHDNQLPDSDALIYAKKDGLIDKSKIVDYGGKNNEDIVIPEGVTTIGENAFRDCDINSIKLPSTLITIESWALKGNQLTNISIPSSVTSIGEAAFNANKLSDSQAFIYARKDGKEDKTTLISYGGITKDNVLVPTTVTKIDKGAFMYNSLNSLIITANVQTIGESSLSNNNFGKIVNKTGNIFDWGPIIFGYYFGEYTFEIGKINVRNVDILITNE